MMNKNDYHYVMRRIITFLIISGLSFFLFQSCAKANVITSAVHDGNTTNYYYEINNPNRSTTIYFFNSNDTRKNIFQGAGNGYVYFTINVNNEASGTNIIETIELIGNNGIYPCYFNLNMYKDNTSGSNTTSVICPATLNSTSYINSIFIKRTDIWGSTRIYMSDTIGFDQTDTVDLSSIQNTVNSINSIMSSITNNMGTNTQAIQNSINSAQQATTNAINNQTIQQHSDSQAEQQAINDNTQAINDLNDTINADYQSDTSWYSDFEGVAGNNTNYLRSLLLYPSTLLVSIANAVINNTCSQIDLGTLWGVHLYLPCINWKTYVGNAIYVSIDTIMGIAVLFGIITYIRKLFIYVADFGMTAYETVGVEVFK